ncbi:MAG: hypothetical protein ACXACR_14655 [Candidatus Hodarchaeales archaeon]|jgi:hypothetical protein
MDKEEIRKAYLKNRKNICRLYSGYTPLKEIEKLLRMNEIAYQNELKRILERSK